MTTTEESATIRVYAVRYDALELVVLDVAGDDRPLLVIGPQTARELGRRLIAESRKIAAARS